jgi:hypothetical protein
MIVSRTCFECDRLWRDLSDAAKKCVRIARQQKAVAALPASAALAKMAFRDARRARTKARRAIKDHETRHHQLTGGLKVAAAETHPAADRRAFSDSAY